MSDLTPDHPAVDEAAMMLRMDMMGPNWQGSWARLGSRAKRNWQERAMNALTAALPHLTADDLRNTPAGRDLMAAAGALTRTARLPCGCENPLNPVHVLDH